MTRAATTFKPTTYDAKNIREIRAHYQSDPEFAEAMRAKGLGSGTGLLDRGNIVLYSLLVPALPVLAVGGGFGIARGIDSGSAFMVGVAVFVELAVCFMGLVAFSDFRRYMGFKAFSKAAPSDMFGQALKASEQSTSEELHAWLMGDYGLRFRDGQSKRDMVARSLLMGVFPENDELLKIELERLDGSQTEGYFQQLGNGEFKLLSTPVPGLKTNSFPQLPALSRR